MLFYPKIPGSRNCPDGRCVAFEKYDGTNLHWTWDPAEQVTTDGWASFGTRRDDFPVDPTGVEAFAGAHPELAAVHDTFSALSDAPLVNLIRKHHPNASRVTCFTEYVGPRSFAGMHAPGDSMRLVLFDVEVDGRMLGPTEFVEQFGRGRDLAVARVVYQGKLPGRFVEDVRAGKYKVAEGVVCKGVKTRWMSKIKTNAYLERLKAFDPKGWEQYWE